MEKRLEPGDALRAPRSSDTPPSFCPRLACPQLPAEHRVCAKEKSLLDLWLYSLHFPSSCTFIANADRHLVYGLWYKIWRQARTHPHSAFCFVRSQGEYFLAILATTGLLKKEYVWVFRGGKTFVTWDLPPLGPQLALVFFLWVKNSSQWE